MQFDAVWYLGLTTGTLKVLFTVVPLLAPDLHVPPVISTDSGFPLPEM
jgi:hypothetical protein